MSIYTNPPNCANDRSEKARSRGLILLIAGFAGLLAVLGINSHQSGKKLSEQQKAHEAELEKIHSLGFDQGYVEAVTDAYLGEPRYMLTEENGGQIKLWKKTPLDPVYSKKLNEKLQNTYE
jgi:hypothetical protein